MNATDDLATLQANNQADATALTSLETELNTPAVESIGDNLLASVVTFLEDQGYTVTAPVSETAETSEASDATSDTATSSDDTSSTAQPAA